jgi:gamma-glutamyltranspeptidase/glutathione hydrolase
MLESFAIADDAPQAPDGEGGRPGVNGVHRISEAERLAYADRDRYVADTDFVALPGDGVSTLLDKDYLRGRVQRVDPAKSMGVAPPGAFGSAPQAAHAGAAESGTSQITVADRYGNVLSMTTSIESSMGAYRMVEGFMLNNQLTDFSALPADAGGTPIANRIEPGKRPRSSMAPTLVFEAAADGSRGDWLMATGSPGGASIIQYVVKTLVGVLDWQLDAQQAANLVDFGAANSPVTQVGGEHPNIDERDDGAHDALVSALRARGHTVSVRAQSSGIASIVRVRRDGSVRLFGAADPRREGLALGDP